jgi:protein-S-isoprenylcysteine O-methyltransferase Ste14
MATIRDKLGQLRLLVLYARGARVFAPDRARTPSQVLGDALAGARLLRWWYELVAYARPLPFHVIPTALGVVLFYAVGLKAIGAAMWVVGLVVYGLALWAMGDWWRIGIDRERPGAPVTGAIFGWSRNPIDLGFGFCALGTSLVQGRLVFLLMALLLAVMPHALIGRGGITSPVPRATPIGGTAVAGPDLLFHRRRHDVRATVELEIVVLDRTGAAPVALVHAGAGGELPGRRGAPG